MTPKELADAVLAAVRRATSALDKRIAQLEERLANLPTPEKGERGEQGDKGDAGEDGLDGRDGEKGERGPKGDSVGLGEVIQALQPQVKSFLDAIPAPQPPPLQDVIDALTPSLEGFHARWALDFERRAQETLQRACDRIPKPADGKDGRDGVDALGLEDLQADYDGERTVTLTLSRGELSKSVVLKLPVPIDRGVYREGTAYERGDVVTWGGSSWIAQTDAPEGKPEASRDWRLSVKRGRDGAKGEAGRDLRDPKPVKVGS